MGWDIARLLAFVDVASFHMTSRHGLLGIGLPTFALVSFTLATSFGTPDTEEYARKLFSRLGSRWVFWWCVFATWRTLSCLRHGQGALSWLGLTGVLAGPFDHLWFFPFLIVGDLVAHVIYRICRGLDLRVFFFWCLLASIPAFWVLDVFPQTLPEPLPRFELSAGALPFALGIGRALTFSSDPTRTRKTLFAFVSALIIVGLGVHAFHHGDRSMIARYLVSMALIAAFSVVPSRIDRYTFWIRPLLLGCFVLHPIVEVLLVMRLPISKLHVSNDFQDVIRVLVLVTVTLGLTMILRRTPLRRVL